MTIEFYAIDIEQAKKKLVWLVGVANLARNWSNLEEIYTKKAKNTCKCAKSKVLSRSNG